MEEGLQEIPDYTGLINFIADKGGKYRQLYRQAWWNILWMFLALILGAGVIFLTHHYANWPMYLSFPLKTAGMMPLALLIKRTWGLSAQIGGLELELLPIAKRASLITSIKMIEIQAIYNVYGKEDVPVSIIPSYLLPEEIVLACIDYLRWRGQTILYHKILDSK